MKLNQAFASGRKKVNLQKCKHMAVARAIDKEINQYLGHLNTRQKQAVLTVVKTFAGEEDYDHWKDKDFVSEMDKRFAEMESGKVKGLTLEQMEAGARRVYKNRKRK